MNGRNARKLKCERYYRRMARRFYAESFICPNCLVLRIDGYKMPRYQGKR